MCDYVRFINFRIIIIIINYISTCVQLEAELIFWSIIIVNPQFKRNVYNNNNNQICKAPECQKTSVALV